MEIYRHQGKKYTRQGSCDRCGNCCLGWAKGPCPFLTIDYNGLATCLTYEAEEWPEDARCSKQARIDFPDTVAALWHPSFQKCGYWFIEIEDILVACPTYVGKDYCKERYLACYEALDWPAKELMMVDTTHYPGSDNDKIASGMEQIRKHFLAGNYTRWFNIEADVLVPPETVKEMLKFDPDKNMDWISHNYPNRVTGEPGMSGFGCSMFSRRIMEIHTFEGAPSDRTTDGWWWHTKVRHDLTIRALELWGVLDIKHVNS